MPDSGKSDVVDYLPNFPELFPVERVVRPEDHKSLTLDLTYRDGAPGAAVAALVAVIAHGEDVSFQNFEGFAVRELRVELMGRELVIRKCLVVGQKVGGAERGKIVASARAGHTLGISVIFDRDAVDVECATLRLDSVAANGDDSFDEVPGFLVKGNEHKHIPSRGFMHVEEFDVRARDADAVDKLADENAIAHEQGVFHRARGDLERLDDEGTHKPEDKCDGDHDGPKVSPCQGASESTPSRRGFFVWFFRRFTH